MKKKLNNLVSKIKEGAAFIWDKFTTGVANFLAWCVKNKELAIFLLSALVTIVKHTTKIVKMRKEDEWRNRRFYDRRTDRWCYARKHLSRRQQNIIEERYRDGETYRSILDSMGLLK